MNKALNQKLETLATCLTGLTIGHAEGKITDVEALEAVCELLEGLVPDDGRDTASPQG